MKASATLLLVKEIIFLIPEGDMSTLNFTIAGLGIEMKTEIPVRISQGFIPFMADSNDLNTDRLYRACFQKTDRLEFPYNRKVVCTRDFTVYEERPEVYIRVYQDGRNGMNYAVSRFDPETRRMQIRYLPESEKNFSETGNSFFHMEWENLLISEHRLIVHAACVTSREVGGILFSGPSGAGKSTQAELWRQHMDARMLNGDRTILSMQPDGWMAYGSPYAGSSRCYVNESCRVSAVVFVKKAKVNSVHRMRPMEAFQKIFGSLTINSWDSRFVNRACDLTEKLICEIPVYEMTCTPDKRAVEALYHELLKGIR